VRAPVERGWKFLLDPRAVVPCLPGAELGEVIDACTFTGHMKVKVGPVTLVYKGRLQFTEIDEAAHRVKLVGEGTDKSGGGSAQLAMESVVRAIDGATEVAFFSKVDVAGRIVQFGRGMMLGVAQQLFKQFSDRARASLELAEASSPIEAAAPVGGVPMESPAGSATPAAPAALAAPRPTLPPAEPVSALSLLLKAFWAWLRRLFGRGDG
jgi:carbon monoxide dehydrogenase subunit G